MTSPSPTNSRCPSCLQAFTISEDDLTVAKGNTIAYRKCQPQDYLHGEWLGGVELPAGIPVLVALEIVDPGEIASRYALTLVPSHLSHQQAPA